VNPFTVSTTIDLPRERVFEYLSDIAHHAEFSDHYMVDWHLLREDSVGVGAGARFRIKAPLSRFSWADVTIAEAQPPFRIVTRGRGGKFNRIKMLGVWEIHQAAGGGSRLEYTFESDPPLPSDRLLEIFGGRAWTKRKAGRALRRLRSILESGRSRGTAVSVAGR
jgi:uncharacterized protein YndB with AHSA1/START domain